jgi:tyrosine-protein phosphatase YwqE
VPVISTIERRVEQLQMVLDQTRKEKQASKVAVAPLQEITDEDRHIANMANLSINQLKDSPYAAIRLIRMTYPDCTMDRMVSCYNRIYASV